MLDTCYVDDDSMSSYNKVLLTYKRLIIFTTLIFALDNLCPRVRSNSVSSALDPVKTML